MNPRASLSGLDSAFLSLETPSTPMHMMGTFVLDASSADSGYSFERILRLLEERMPDLAHGGAPDSPLVAAIPASLRTSEEQGTYGNRISALLVHLPVHLVDPVEQLLALRHDAAASKQRHADLHKIALEKTRKTLSIRRKQAAPDAAPPSVASN